MKPKNNKVKNRITKGMIDCEFGHLIDVNRAEFAFPALIELLKENNDEKGIEKALHARKIFRNEISDQIIKDFCKSKP